MKAPAWTLLLLGLAASLQAQDAEPEGDPFEGTWFLKAVAANRQIPEAMKPKKSFPVMVTALEDGGYRIQFSFLYKNKCQQKTVEVESTEDPTKFKTPQDIVVSMEEMPVKGNLIFYMEHQVFGMTVRIAKLMARKPEENPEAMREFKKFMKRKKLLVEHMVIPQQLKKCVS